MTAPPTPLTLRSPELATLLAGIAEGAAARERDDVSPFEQVATVMRAGLGTVSLPRTEGGQGATIRDLIALVIDLAEADPIVAHILRTHFHQVLTFLALPDPDVRRRWLDEVRAGRVFGNAISETGTVAAGNHDFATTLTERGGRWFIDGTKSYCTGTLYADRIGVAARVEGDRVATIVVPADRPGVAVVDDWDAMGQRRTGTGTTSFTDVAVEPGEVVSTRPRLSARPPGDVAFVQLYLHAVIAGILRNVATDAAGLVRTRSRSFDHAPAPRPVDDPVLHETVGTVAATAWVAESAVLAAADCVDTAMNAGPQRAGDLGAAASLAVSKVKVHVDKVALEAATALFDVGGASSASRTRDLDRHWRNIRTITLHNPASYKAVAIGRTLVTGEALPVNGYF